MSPQLHLTETVEISHVHGREHGAAVVIRSRAPGAMMTGYYSTDDARAMAEELTTEAARADYEDDFIRAATDVGYSDAAIDEVLGLIRERAEQRRSEGTTS